MCKVIGIKVGQLYKIAYCQTRPLIRSVKDPTGWTTDRPANRTLLASDERMLYEHKNTTNIYYLSFSIHTRK